MSASDKRPSGIPTRRYLTFWVAACVLGVVFGVVGGLMDWSHDVAFVVLAVAGTITGAVTLHTDLFDGLRLPSGLRRRPRRHA